MGPDDEPAARKPGAFFRGDDHAPAAPREPSPVPRVELAKIEADFAALERDYAAASDKARFLGKVRALRRAIGNRRAQLGSIAERLARIESEVNLVIGERKTRKHDILVLAERAARSTDWKAAGEQMDALMARWKSVGWAGDAEEYLWQRFRAEINAFHERRLAFFEGRDDALAENLRRKEELAAQAERLAQMADAPQAAQEFKALQTAWNEIGSVPSAHAGPLAARLKAAGDRIFSQRHTEWREMMERVLRTRRAEAAQLRAAIAADENELHQWHRMLSDRYTGARVENERALREQIAQAEESLWEKRRAIDDLQAAIDELKAQLV